MKTCIFSGTGLLPFILGILFCLPPPGEAQPAWDGTIGSPGTNGDVLALTVFDDGNGSLLYSGGDFTQAGSTSVNYIGRWTGTAWQPLGNGTSGPIFALAVYDDGSGPALYAGGNFITAGSVSVNNIAKWNGTDWSALGTGTTGNVLALTVYDDGSGPALYAGGSFATAGSATVNNIAKWNGTTWSALGTGTDGPVNALAVFDGGAGPALQAGGFFNNAGSTSASNIAQWDGTAWSALGSGINGPVFALKPYDDGTGTALYTGGGFTTAGGVNANGIARWDGNNWFALSQGSTNGPVLTLEVLNELAGPVLYAGGGFTLISGANANYIAKWNGASWSSLGSGTDNTVNSLAASYAPFATYMFTGGTFSTAGQSANNIARWNPGITELPTTIRSVSYLDSNNSGTVNAGDALVLTFNNRISFVQSTITPGTFALPVSGDSLGSGAIMFINPFNSRQIRLQLGASPQFNVQGIFSTANLSPGSPSGLDIGLTMTGAIRDEFGLDVEDSGIVNTPDTARDLQYAAQTKTTIVTASGGADLRPGASTYYNKHRLLVPPGAVTSDTSITVRSANLGNLSAVEIVPATAMNSMVEATVEYKPFNVNLLGGDLEEGMQVRGWNPILGQWIPLSGPQQVNTREKTVTAHLFFSSTGVSKPGSQSLLLAGGFTVFGNVGIPTVKNASGSYDWEGSKPDALLAANSILQTGTGAVYTKHQIVLTGYIPAASITVELKQVTLLEKASMSYTKNAILKVTTTGETNNSDLLTLEYKDDNDPVYNSDIPSGYTESDMRLYAWNSTGSNWVQISGTQTLDTTENTVTATVVNLASSQFYSVQPGTGAITTPTPTPGPAGVGAMDYR